MIKPTKLGLRLAFNKVPTWYPLINSDFPANTPDKLRDFSDFLVWGSDVSEDTDVPNPYDFALGIIGPWVVRSVFRVGATSGVAHFYLANGVGALAGRVAITR